MPTVNEDEEEEQPKMEKELQPTEEEVKDLNRETEVENVIISQEPLKVRILKNRFRTGWLFLALVWIFCMTT